MGDLGSCPMEYWLNHVLPRGFFVIQEEQSNIVTGACLAAHLPTPRHPFAGILGWLAVDPAYRGNGFGQTLSAAVTRRLIEAGYERIYLNTDDHRLPAIKTYLNLGWVPFLYQEDMAKRWELVCRKLDWEYSPWEWPSSESVPGTSLE
jgi:mycothiol synthase